MQKKNILPAFLKNLVRKDFNIYFFFFLVSLLLAYIWFHRGLIVALGESAIPFYNPNIVLHFYGQTWVPVSLGYFPGTTLSSIPFFTIMAWLWNIPLPGYLVQAIYFSVFALIATVSGYILYKNLFMSMPASDRKIIGVIGGLFYLLNMISLVIAFNRLQYPFLLFYLSLPVSLGVFSLGLYKKNLMYVLYFNFILIPFSMALGTLPFLELFWLVLGAYTVYYIVVERKRTGILFPILYLLSCGIVWLLFNAWWFVQLVQYALFTPHPAYDLKANIGTFNILSEDQGNLSYIFRLINRHFLISMIPTWGGYYFTPIFTAASYVIPVLAFLPLLFRKKPKVIYFLLGFALFTVFFTKGSADPFGEFFLLLFSKSQFFEVFRNSFEKIGLVLPITYSGLIGFSLVSIGKYLFRRFNPKFAYGFVLTTVIVLCGMLVYPFWNGLVFTYNLPPANDPNIGDYVEVPEYYRQANEYLEKNPTDTRIVALPMGGEGMTYSWRHPYNGVEYTNGLLKRSAISYTTIMPYLEDITTQLNYTFTNENEYFAEIMHLLHAEYLMLRSDIDYKSRLMPNPKDFISLASKGIKDLSIDKTFGKLQFYKLHEKPEKIYVSNDLFAAPRTIRYVDVMSQTGFKKKDTIITTSEKKHVDEFAASYAKETFFEPEYIIDYSSYPEVGTDSAQLTLPAFYRFLPGSPLYAYNTIKERIERTFVAGNEDKMFYDMDILSKRLGELQRTVLDRNLDAFHIARSNYTNHLFSVEEKVHKEYTKEVKKNINNFRYRVIAQKAILDNLLVTVADQNYKRELLKLSEALEKFSINTHVKSIYDAGNYVKENPKRLVFQYVLQTPGQYNLILKDENFNSYYTGNDEEWKIYINNNEISIFPDYANGWYDFGSVAFLKGINEVHIVIPESKNLVADSVGYEKRLFADKAKSQDKLSFKVLPFDAYAPHKITFDYQLNVSGGAKVQAESEFDTVQNGKYIPQWSADLGASYRNEWNKAAFIFYPYSTSSQQTISIVAEAVNNCLRENQLNTFNIDRCKKDRAFRDRYIEATDLLVKNIKVERVFSNKVLLKYLNPSYKISKNKPSVTYTRINASEYKVAIKEAKEPFLLVFSETNYPAWEAIFSDSGTKVSPKNHLLVNTFANAWYIDRAGSYEMYIRFGHEKYFLYGKLIAFPSMFVGFLFVVKNIVFNRKRKYANNN